jgi:hypothetical protein
MLNFSTIFVVSLKIRASQKALPTEVRRAEITVNLTKPLHRHPKNVSEMRIMPEINPQRLMNDLRHLRSIGQYGTGVVRPAFSTKDMEARQWLLDWMGTAGLKASMDGVGNVIGQFSNPGKGILIGSHTDTQPQGGWLDGSLGVLYGFEIAKAFAEDRRTAHFVVDLASCSDSGRELAA